jgi:ribonuclease T2
MRVLLRLHPLLLLLTLSLLPCSGLRAQQVSASPGQFDFYLLNLSWSPEFCHNVEVLPQSERAAKRARRAQDAATECGTPHGFVLHGMWPQNFSGTWPGNCSTQPGPANYTPYLTDTPSLTLLQHEWTKHGTCSGLAPDQFFTTADHAYAAVQVPPQLQSVTQTLQLKTSDVLAAFYRVNPSWPQGSLALSCGRNYLTAIEVCLSKNGQQPIACQNVHACAATTIKVAPEPALQQ